MQRGEYGPRVVSRVEDHETRARAQTNGHQLVTRVQGNNRSLLLRDPGAYVRRERSTIGGEAYRVWLLQIVGRPVAGDSALSKEKERHCQYRVSQKQERSLEPVRFRISDHRCRDKHSQSDARHFHRREREIHRLMKRHSKKH